MTVQIHVGRDVHCMPGVAHPHDRGQLSRNISPGLTKAFKLSVTAEKQEEKYEHHYSTLSHNTSF